LVCKLDEAGDDGFDALHAGVLGDVLVLHETLLCGAALAHVDAELDEAVHNGLEGGERGGPESF
jgi:hypothetical protein